MFGLMQDLSFSFPWCWTQSGCLIFLVSTVFYKFLHNCGKHIFILNIGINSIVGFVFLLTVYVSSGCGMVFLSLCRHTHCCCHRPPSLFPPSSCGLLRLPLTVKLQDCWGIGQCRWGWRYRGVGWISCSLFLHYYRFMGTQFFSKYLPFPLYCGWLMAFDVGGEGEAQGVRREDIRSVWIESNCRNTFTTAGVASIF